MLELLNTLSLVLVFSFVFGLGLLIGEHIGEENAWKDYTLSATIAGHGEFHPVSGRFKWFPCMWVDE